MNTIAILAMALAVSDAGTTAPSQCAGHLVMGVDVSSSISRAQLAAWRPVAQKRLDALCPDDQIALFTVDAYTLTSAPLFEGAVPRRPDSGTMEDLIKYRRALTQFRASVSAAFDRAFSGDGKASATDIFSLFERALQGQHREFMVFSDGLHCAKDLDLENKPLRVSTVSSVIRQLTSVHRWNAGYLAGASVRFVLASPATNGPPRGPNDYRLLHDFYNALIQSLGGRLDLFDSYLH
jgi:hypothetical protein